MRAPGSRGWPGGPEGPGDVGKRRRGTTRIFPLRGLDRLPVGDDLGNATHGEVLEDVRMAANDLRAQRAVDIGQVEGARFGRQLGMEDDLKVEVAELLGEVGRGAALDGIDRLVGFLEEKGPEGSMVLASIPRAAIRGPEASADGRHPVR